jgi:hypothetical protein
LVDIAVVDKLDLAPFDIRHSELNLHRHISNFFFGETPLNGFRAKEEKLTTAISN